MLLVLVRVGVLLPLVFFACLASGQSSQYSQGGYANRHSVAAGETIAFHIANSRSPFDVTIVNMAAPNTILRTITGLVSQARDCTGMWENGCNWPVTTLFTVPAEFTPGYYAARFRTGIGDRHILFVVRPPVLGSYAPIAVIQPSNTDVAYNRYGGKSVYDAVSDDGHRAHVVSFNRPYFDDTGFARFRIWEQRFVNWMTAEGRRFEVITDDDMEAEIPLGAYKMLMIVGHSEYWSLKARRHLEAFVAGGGHLAVLGGNTMWWQVRVDLQARQMTVYKDAALDPLTGVDDDVVTTNFTEWPVLHPENSILGASFLNAGYVNDLDSRNRLPIEERTPYTVRRADHWIFEGTGLSNGAQMGASVGAIEVDGALFNTLPNGDVEVEGSDGTPLSYEVLATLPASDGYGTIGMYVHPQGGAVFNGAARDWSYGLIDFNDPVIQRITRNVFDRFETGAPFPYDPRQTPNRAEDRFNHPVTSPEYLPGWRFHRFGFELTSRCAQEGPFGLELTGPYWTQVVRNLAVGRDGITKAAANLWINADLLQSTPDFATKLLAFLDYRGESEQIAVAAIEMMMRPGGLGLRASSFRGSTPVSSTAWLILPPGWHSVQLAWESGGLLELNVSGQKVSAVNAETGQKMNALRIDFAGSIASGSVCVDHLQFRNAFAPASHTTSTITASPASLPADGVSTANVLVRLLDAEGNAILNGGDTVTLATTEGSLSAVTDRGDGTYAATLTSSTSSSTAIVSATVNGQTLTQTASVTFATPAASLSLTGAATATAGQPVTFTVAADDDEGQPAVGYRGTVHFTSEPAATLPSDYAFTSADAGRHDFTATAPLAAGSWTVTVTDTGAPGLTDSLTIDVWGETTTTLSASPNPAFAGDSVTLTAAINSSAAGSIAGTVTFRDGTTILGTASVSGGVAEFSINTLAEGQHSLTAEYGGGGGFLGSTSQAVQQVIEPRFGAPQNLVATGVSTSSVNVSWSAAGGVARYELFRRGSNGSYQLVAATTATSVVDSGLTSNNAYLYYVRAISTSGATSANSPVDAAVTVLFYDDPIIPGKTRIRAVHLTQLRTAINALRATAGLSAATFTDASLIGQVVRPVHVLELRDALAAARSAAGLAPVEFSAPAPAPGEVMRAAHIQELRDALR